MKAEVIALAELDDDIDWDAQVDAPSCVPTSTPPEQTWLLPSAKLGYASIADDTAVDRTGSSRDVQMFWIGVGDQRHRMIFCTVVTRDRGTPAIWAWPTETAARDGHRLICAWLAEHGDEPAGRRRWSP